MVIAKNPIVFSEKAMESVLKEESEIEEIATIEPEVIFTPEVSEIEELDEVLGDTENVADPDEDLKLQGLALGSAGLPGLVDGQRPAQAKANQHCNFQKLRHGRQPSKISF